MLNKPYKNEIKKNENLTEDNIVPICKSGQIQDRIFEEDNQLWLMLKKQQHIEIEGLTYKQIEQDPIKINFLKSLNHNMPPYWNLKGIKKQKYFNQCNQQYLKKIKNNIKSGQKSNKNHKHKIINKKHVTFTFNKTYKEYSQCCKIIDISYAHEIYHPISQIIH